MKSVTLIQYDNKFYFGQESVTSNQHLDFCFKHNNKTNNKTCGLQTTYLPALNIFRKKSENDYGQIMQPIAYEERYCCPRKVISLSETVCHLCKRKPK